MFMIALKLQNNLDADLAKRGLPGPGRLFLLRKGLLLIQTAIQGACGACPSTPLIQLHPCLLDAQYYQIL